MEGAILEYLKGLLIEMAKGVTIDGPCDEKSILEFYDKYVELWPDVSRAMECLTRELLNQVIMINNANNGDASEVFLMHTKIMNNLKNALDNRNKSRN
jgi:hypothetical protein